MKILAPLPSRGELMGIGISSFTEIVGAGSKAIARFGAKSQGQGHEGEHAPMGVRIFFWVRDVNALYEEVIRRGVAIEVPIETRPYRVRDFSIRDRTVS
jgi:hypothetical protein